jgi:hypothetical protein
MDRMQFEARQYELKQKISVVNKLALVPNNLPEDLKIYAKQCKTFLAIKKRNATIYSKQTKQLQINL